MKREIKFRKLTDWAIDEDSNYVENSGFAYGTFNGENVSWEHPKGYAIYGEEDNTIGQYTGLKDYNGKEIYEGDIVEWIDEDEREHVDVVTWVGVGYFLYNPSYISMQYLYDNVEVIGNIHENKDLVEKYNLKIE